MDLIIEHAAGGIDRLVDDLADEADKIEDQILGGRLRDERRRLGELRRTAVRLHRQLAGLRTLFHRFERSGRGEINQTLRLSISQLTQRLDALDHEVVAIQERSRLLQEEITAKIAEESNRHLHALSIVTTLLLPPTLVFGIFGMNTRDLPFSGTPNGTAWAIAMGATAAGGVYLFLRRLLTFR
jgi:zinc transporter